MNWLSMQPIYERIEWIKQKACWLLIALLIATSFSIIALWCTAAIFFFAQPQDYKAIAMPQFQTKRNDGYKLVAVFQNAQLKSQLCSRDDMAYTGHSIDQQQFCNFKYQALPKMHQSFDVTLLGLQSMDIRYASVCLLKMPKNNFFQMKRKNQSDNQTERDSWRSSWSRNRYVCQKYRAYQALHIINDMLTDELYFMEIQLELTQKGYQQLGAVDVRLQFEQERGKAMRIFIDNYFWIAFAVCFCVAMWVGAVSLVIGVAVIVNIILKERQEKEQQMLQNIIKMKRQ